MIQVYYCLRADDFKKPTKLIGGHTHITKDFASDNLPQLTVKSSLPTNYEYPSTNSLNLELSSSKSGDENFKMDLLTVPSSPVEELTAPPSFKPARINSTVEFK